MREAFAPADELDLSAVGRALLRKKMWVIGPTLVAALIAFATVNVMTPRYRSEARILIDGRENVFLRPEADKLAERERSIDQEAVTSQVQLVLARDLARKVAHELKLNERPEFDPLLSGASIVRQIAGLAGLARDPFKMTTEERVLEAYYERLTAYPVDKSRVIAIEFSSADPELAAKAANTVAQAYLELQQAARQEQTRLASQWLGNETESLRQRVAEAEAKVEAFRARSNLFVGANNTSLSSQQLGELNSQLALARSQKADAGAKAKLLRDLLRSGQPIEFSDVVNSELIRRLAEQGATLRAQLAEQSSTLLGSHPRIKELKAQITDLDVQIRREAEKLVRSFENDARIAGARVEALGSSLDQLKALAATSSEQDIQLRALEREAKAQRDLLESYLAKYREANARDSLASVAEARIISRALVSNTPAFPKKVPIVLIVTLATFLLSAAFITTGELLAGNVYAAAGRPEETEREPEVAIPDAGVASTADAPSEPAVAVPVVSAPATGDTEKMIDPVDRLARALHDAGAAARCVTVLGAARHLGTTSTAIAVARALAREGRVVLIDLSLEAPNIGTISSEPGAPGVAELVRGAASFRHIITRDRASRLHLIGAGRIPADTSSILQSERLGIGLSALARTYDHVLIDAGALTGAALDRLVKLAPYAVLVAPGVADALVDEARERLFAAGFTEVSLVVDTPPRPDAGTTGPSTAAA